MLTELLMQDERRAGREEGHRAGRVVGHRESVLELLTELGTVPKELYEKINKETNVDRLKFWAKLAAKAESLEQFLAKM